MQKKSGALIKKVLTVILTICAVLLMFSRILPVRAGDGTRTVSLNGNDAVIADLEDLLSDEEERLLLEQITPLTEYGNIAFLSDRAPSGETTEYVRNWYGTRYNRNSGTVFFVDMNNRQIFIYSNGANYDVVTDTVADNITDKVYRYASRGDYYGCASESFSQIATVLGGGWISMPMKYISNALVAMGLSLIICYLFAYGCSHAQRSSNDELLTYVDKSFNYTKPTLTFTRTEKKYHPRSSGSGGGGRSGGGGGGGFGGGGGGHGF